MDAFFDLFIQPALDQGFHVANNYNKSMDLEAYHIELIGYCAAFLTTIAFLPQAIQSWRSRDLSGISLGMYSLFTVGVGLWLIYGLIVILVIIIVLILIILAWYRRRRKPKTQQTQTTYLGTF